MEPKRQTQHDDRDRRRHLLRGPIKGKRKKPKKPLPYNPHGLTLTKSEAALELRVSIRTLDDLIKKGLLVARQLNTNRTLRILRSDLVAFLENQKTG